MNTAQMEYMILLAEELRISRAAERLYISASALSQSLAKVEAELGYQLFVRSNNDFILTPEGEQFINCCKKILKIYKDTNISIERQLRSKRRTIAFGMAIERASFLLAKCYPDFHSKFPEYTIVLHEGFSSEQPLMVEKGEVDFAVSSVFTPQNINRNTLQYDVIGYEELGVYVSRENELYLQYKETGQPVKWSQLDGQRFIHHGKGKYSRRVIDYSFEKHNLYPEIIMELDSTDLCIQFAEVNLGVTLASRSFAYRYPGAIYLPMEEPIIWSLSLLYRKDKKFTAAELYFCECLKKLYQATDSILPHEFI